MKRQFTQKTNQNSQKIVGDLREALGTTIAEHETERRERGEGVAWGDARDLLAGKDDAS